MNAGTGMRRGNGGYRRRKEYEGVLVDAVMT
jgi:hypothetical protein